jgi:hypothetical protein
LSPVDTSGVAPPPIKEDWLNDTIWIDVFDLQQVKLKEVTVHLSVTISMQSSMFNKKKWTDAPLRNENLPLLVMKSDTEHEDYSSICCVPSIFPWYVELI